MNQKQTLHSIFATWLRQLKATAVSSDAITFLFFSSARTLANLFAILKMVLALVERHCTNLMSSKDNSVPTPLKLATPCLLSTTWEWWISRACPPAVVTYLLLFNLLTISSMSLRRSPNWPCRWISKLANLWLKYICWSCIKCIKISALHICHLWWQTDTCPHKFLVVRHGQQVLN